MSEVSLKQLGISMGKLTYDEYLESKGISKHSWIQGILYDWRNKPTWQITALRNQLLMGIDFQTAKKTVYAMRKEKDRKDRNRRKMKRKLTAHGR